MSHTIKTTICNGAVERVPGGVVYIDGLASEVF